MSFHQNPIRNNSLSIYFLIIVTMFTACAHEPAKDEKPNIRASDVFNETQDTDLEGIVVGNGKTSDWKVTESSIVKSHEVFGIEFTNENIGWLFGSKRSLLKTSDAGENWKPTPVPIPVDWEISYLRFATAETGCLIANKPYERDEDTPIQVLCSHDGGSTWNERYSNTTVEPAGIEFANQAVGYIFGSQYDGGRFHDGVASSSKYFLTKTEDGGQSWKDISGPLNDIKVSEDANSGVSYLSDTPTQMITLSPDRIQLITHSRRLLETVDGGITWHKIGNYLHDDQQVGIKNFGNKDDGTKWMFESTYSVEGVRARLKTSNSSNQVIRYAVWGVYLSNVYYFGGNQFIASGNTGDMDFGKHDNAIVWATDDNGKTWSEIYRNSRSKAVSSMSQVSRNSFWALCDDNKIVHFSRKKS